MSPNATETDVLVCGGGPVGLLTAYCLSRYGIKTAVIEKHSHVQKVQYGRGVLIMPRTLELLDQLDLADALNQIGFISRGRRMYKNGKRLEGLETNVSTITDTFFNYTLLCRQRWTEQVIADAYMRMENTSLQYGTTLVKIDVEQDGAYSTIETQSGQNIQIRSKYIVGADGGHSTVRDLAGILFEGEKSNDRWVRMPESRAGVSFILSESHGTVLWACLVRISASRNAALILLVASQDILHLEMNLTAQSLFERGNTDFEITRITVLLVLASRFLKSAGAQERISRWRIVSLKQREPWYVIGSQSIILFSFFQSCTFLAILCSNKTVYDNRV